MHDTCTCMYNMALSKAYCFRRNFELAYLSTTFGSAVCFTTSVRNLIAYIKKTTTTRGPWATSLTWENSSNQFFFHWLREEKKPINFILIYCFFIWRPKIGWNWLSGSREENLLISSMSFRYFKIISPWKRARPFICINLNPLHPRMLCTKFGWNWPSGSGEEYF